MADGPVTDLAAGVLSGSPRGMARAISLMETETSESAALLRALHVHTGRAYLVGITGSPGAGKSTLVDRLIAMLRQRGLTVGVIAVDPSSPFTGGALLGDRVRMGGHAGDPGVFIRSMATRGHLGGLARATSDAVAVLDAAGRDIVVVETVGVGQDEVEIAGTADVSVLVLSPGSGDEVQAIKAGIMEIANIFVVNKSDLGTADRAAEAVASALALRAYAAGEWQPPVLKASALSGDGVEAVWAAVEQFRARTSEGRAARERDRQGARLRDLLVRGVLRRIDSLPPGAFDQAVDRVAARTQDPYSAADELTRLICREPVGSDDAMR
jgi:LAO/AO transport system kinase